jgi:hypothetical protein
MAVGNKKDGRARPFFIGILRLHFTTWKLPIR